MKLLIDMDGVLVDFMQGVIDRYNLPFDPYPCPGSEDFYPFVGMSKAAFWKGLDEDFWANLQWTPDGRKILRIAQQHFQPADICILSSPSSYPASLAGKHRWICTHMPDYRKRYLIGPAKHFCASGSAVLLDDLDRNVDRFKKAGGNAILVPRPWNSAFKNARHALKMITEELADLSSADC